MSLCEIPPPDQELVDKYENMKSVFYKRILVAFNKLQAAAAPVVEKIGQSDQTQAAKDYVDQVQGKSEFQAVVKVAS